MSVMLVGAERVVGFLGRAPFEQNLETAEMGEVGTELCGPEVPPSHSPPPSGP